MNGFVGFPQSYREGILKAIILAAGRGSRMGRYTTNLPKGMLEFQGKPLIGWQIDILREIGIHDVIIVRGYKGDCINFDGVRYYQNYDYFFTNMVETLIRARCELNSDVLISYSDIIYCSKVAQETAGSPHDISIAVDKNWKWYWEMRHGTTETDLETLATDDAGKIIDIGKPVKRSEGVSYRYIGLNKFSKEGMRQLLDFYDRKRKRNEIWFQSGQPFEKGYMTDLLSEMISSNIDIMAVYCEGGWLEFDTDTDYERASMIFGRQMNKGFW